MPETQCGFKDGPGVKARELLVLRGPTLKVDLGFDPAYDPSNPRRLAELPVRGAFALIDTGASTSCIDSALAMHLALPIIDQRTCAGISGSMQVNMHLAQIHVPSLLFTLYGGFAGVDIGSGGQRHDVLIGRDFLRHFRMVYDGPSGGVTLADPI